MTLLLSTRCNKRRGHRSKPVLVELSTSHGPKDISGPFFNNIESKELAWRIAFIY
jgi:hypothetical protein